MSVELSKTYDPGEMEPRCYRLWEESGRLRAGSSSGRPYCITIPPPNVTGELHMGHALQHVIHDLIVRRKRMLGCDVLCLPGTDHAGIGTQMKVEQALRSEGSDRRTLGREAFIRRSREWTLRFGGAILGQLRSLGCSYDWTRTSFTLDEFVESGPETADWALGSLYERSGYARAVASAFVEFHRRGWLYRGERIVNWCPECRTVVSDLEVEHREVEARLWRFRYPGEDGGEGVVVATTRPETMLGDTGVAVSPSDARYTGLVGRRVLLPLMDRWIPVVADHHVDPEFGTGAVKVTPAHDPNDWDIAQRHPTLLPPVQVIGDDGCMTGAAGDFAGLGRREARERVLAALEGLGLMLGSEPHVHQVGHHDRCGSVIEPLLKLQWFARCRELADLALGAVRQGRVEFVPARFRQMEIEWLEGIRDWCVSRQLWWGHRIPFWYCLECNAGELELDGEGEILQVLAGASPVASPVRPERCARCGDGEFRQDPDVLDTWFSSALWPHATLGWPERTPDLQRYYPTDLMITGRDILYLWVARMMMTGEALLGREPFRQVLIHATVLTEDGKRMSKSLGTGVDPLELIRLYGADATRLGLAGLVTESQDIRFKMVWRSGGKQAKGPEDSLARAEQIEQMRNFCTKLWNIARFVHLSIPPDRQPTALDRLRSRDAELSDRWILSRLSAAVEAVNRSLDAYEIGQAVWTLYHFMWDEFADWYVELAKPRLRAGGESSDGVGDVLLSVLECFVRLAHPFIPFITEEIWRSLPGRRPGELLMTAGYPQVDPGLRDEAAEREMSELIEIVRAIRNMKADLGAPSARMEAHVSGIGPVPASYVEAAARVSLATELGADALRLTLGDCEIAVRAGAAVDPALQSDRLRRELAAVEKDLAGVRTKLGNPSFVQRAPAEIVAKQRALEAELDERRARIQERLEALAGIVSGV